MVRRVLQNNSKGGGCQNVSGRILHRVGARKLWHDYMSDESRENKTGGCVGNSKMDGTGQLQAADRGAKISLRKSGGKALKYFKL